MLRACRPSGKCTSSRPVREDQSDFVNTLPLAGDGRVVTCLQELPTLGEFLEGRGCVVVAYCSKSSSDGKFFLSHCAPR